jgi:hypothetical protein
MARVPVARVALSLRARSERLAWRSARSPFGRVLPRCTAARSRCDSVERVIGRATHHPPSAPPRPAPGRWANRWAKSASIRRSTERSPGASGSSFCLQASHFKPFPGAASDHFTRERSLVRNQPRPSLTRECWRGCQPPSPSRDPPSTGRGQSPKLGQRHPDLWKHRRRDRATDRHAFRHGGVPCRGRDRT